MSLTYTAEQVINKAAADLGKYVPGEALGAVEHEAISKHVDNVLAEISKIIAIADRDEIPAVAFECVAEMVALFASSEFSNVPINRAEMEQIERRLRYLIAAAPTYEPLSVYYF
jgi:hypothetical protein